MHDLKNKAILGTLIHCPKRGAIEFSENALLIIDGEGKIVDHLKNDAPNHEQTKNKFKDASALYELLDHQYLLPGFGNFRNISPIEKIRNFNIVANDGFKNYVLFCVYSQLLAL